MLMEQKRAAMNEQSGAEGRGRDGAPWAAVVDGRRARELHPRSRADARSAPPQEMEPQPREASRASSRAGQVGSDAHKVRDGPSMPKNAPRRPSMHYGRRQVIGCGRSGLLSDADLRAETAEARATHSRSSSTRPRSWRLKAESSVARRGEVGGKVDWGTAGHLPDRDAAVAARDAMVAKLKKARED